MTFSNFGQSVELLEAGFMTSCQVRMILNDSDLPKARGSDLLLDTSVSLLKADVLYDEWVRSSRFKSILFSRWL